ncbi:hypothetical protein EG832_16925 [bacterium]|nr:hypothetical protein [bacterium]
MPILAEMASVQNWKTTRQRMASARVVNCFDRELIGIPDRKMELMISAVHQACRTIDPAQRMPLIDVNTSARR